jgi:Tfp pilus assembly protein PilX
MERTMNGDHVGALHAHVRHAHPESEHGVVLFIALLVMVALSLAGIALIRSADTATVVAGNLAFKQAAAYAVDRGIENAIKALFDPAADPTLSNPAIADKTAHLLAQNYFACVQNDTGTGCLVPPASIPEIPVVLTNRTKFAGAGLNVGLIDATVDAVGNKSYYVIERMCDSAGQAGVNNCNLSGGPSLGADAGTQHYEGLTRSGGAFYRVTVRVEGPRNTVAYAQAILR